MDLNQEIAALTREFAALTRKNSLSPDFGNLSMLQLRILSIIYFRSTPPTMSELADEAGVVLPSASVIADKLEEQQLIERYHRPDDRRIIQVRLTGKGTGLIEGQIQTAESTVKEALGGLSDADKKVVMRFFQLYLHAVRQSHLR